MSSFFARVERPLKPEFRRRYLCDTFVSKRLGELLGQPPEELYARLSAKEQWVPLATDVRLIEMTSSKWLARN